MHVSAVNLTKKPQKELYIDILDKHIFELFWFKDMVSAKQSAI